MKNKLLYAARIILVQSGFFAAVLLGIYWIMYLGSIENMQSDSLLVTSYLHVFTVRLMIVLLPAMAISILALISSKRTFFSFLISFSFLNLISVIYLELAAIADKEYLNVMQRLFAYNIIWVAIFFVSLFVVGEYKIKKP